MWILFGLGAAGFAAANLAAFLRKKETKWFRFFSLSLTALTVCAFYSDAAARVVQEDWGGLMDILPTVSGLLWVCVTGSILLNSFSLWIKAGE